MAKVKASGAKGRIGFNAPNVDRIEVFRGNTTKNPLQLANVRTNSKMMSAEPGTSRKNIISAYNQSAKGKTLFAHGLPPIKFTEKSLQHDFSNKNMSRQKLSILTNHDRMNYLLRNSTVLEKRIKTTSRKGNEKATKKKWQHLWEVKGRVMIGNKDHSFTFTIAQEKSAKTAEIYDIKLRKRK